MLRSRSRPKPAKSLVSRPFFSQVSSPSKATPFFGVQRKPDNSPGPSLQRAIEPEDEDMMQRQPIQRMCADCDREPLDGHPLQAKLELGPASDRYEQEADGVADQVVRSIQRSQPGQVQAQGDRPTPAITPVSRTQENETTAIAPEVEQGIQQSRGSGQAIDQAFRSPMEQAFGADFSNVRIHADGEANQLNHSLNARAFTTGQDIYFKQGAYQPGSQPGQNLLAHELTHVLQQQSLSTMISRQAMPPPNPMDDPRMHPSGAPNAASCSPPSGCPPHFCEPYDSESYARHQRTQLLPILMAGIAVAVNRRVVPLWHEYLLGGSAPKNLTSDFGADFAASPTTANTSLYLRNALQSAIASGPFVAPTSPMTTDMTAWVRSEIAAINTPGDTHQMNFSVPRDIAGNLAGGIGANQTACQAGAQPSPFNDQRLATVGVEFTPNPDGTVTAQPVIQYTVKDTIDLCPGDCGTELERFATVPMSQFEATGISGDVPFTVNFVHRPPPFQV